MRRLIIASLIALFLVCGAASTPVAANDGNWKLVERNTVLLGQIVGCVVRIDDYVNSISLDIFGNEEMRKLAVTNIVGDTDAIMDRLRLAYNKTTDARIQDFSYMINHARQNIQLELQSGLALLQILGCGIMLKDYNIIE